MATMQQVLSQAQVAQINSGASKVAYAPSITGVVALIALVAWGQFGMYGGIIVFFVGFIGTIPVRSRDKARRTTSLYYTDTDERFASIQRACENLAEAQRVWYVEAEQQNWDWKRQAGAQSLGSRKQGRVGVINPPFISTNVDVCGVDAGNSKILFFPDAILVFQQGQYQSVPYKALSVAYTPTRFVEPAPPKDAEIIGYTWQYVNKNGGPDRRFSNNRQIPLALYGLIRVTLSSGVGLQIQVRPEHGPEIGTITLTVEPWLPAEIVVDEYKKAQRKMLGKKPHSISSNRLRVLELVQTMGADLSWRERMDLYNDLFAAKPDEQYKDRSNFRKAYKETRAVVLEPKYTPPKQDEEAARDDRRRDIERKLKRIERSLRVIRRVERAQRIVREATGEGS